MQKILTILNSKKVPRALIICLVFLLCTELMICYFEPNFWTLTNGLVSHKRKLLNQKEKLNFDAIIIGDSRILRLDAKYLSEQVSARLGKKFEIYNFAIPNHGIRTYYILLNKYIREHNKPKYILLSIPPVSVTGEWTIKNTGERTNGLYILGELYPLEELFGVVHFRTFLSMLVIKMERVSSLILFRGRIKEFLEEPSSKNINHISKQHELLNRYNGGNLTQRPFPMTGDEIRDVKYYNWPIYPDDETVYWYKKVCQLAAEHNIKLLIVNAPIFEEILDNRNRDGSNQRYTDLVLQLQQEYKNVEYLAPLLRSYSLENFEDWHHLNKQGAQKFILELEHGLSEYLTDIY